ncbi:MAG: RNA polymerase sigma factor [Thermoguttaceae bacterium]
MKNRLFRTEDLLKFVEQRLPSLLFYAQQWNVDEAEDIVQESLLKLVRYSSEFGRPENLPAWTFRTVRNTAISFARSDVRRKNRETTVAREMSLTLTKPVSEPLEIKEMLTSLNRLPLPEREIVLLRIWGGLSFEEIAETVNQPRSTVHRRYHESLNNLKTELE